MGRQLAVTATAWEGLTVIRKQIFCKATASKLLGIVAGFLVFFVGVWPDSFIHSFIYSMDTTQTDLSKKVSITSIYNQKSAGKFTGSPGAPVLSFRTWSLSISVLCFCFVI